jgi:hypothetical protein
MDMKIFEMPKAEIIALEVADIITTSNENHYNDGEWSSGTKVTWG